MKKTINLLFMINFKCVRFFQLQNSNKFVCSFHFFFSFCRLAYSIFWLFSSYNWRNFFYRVSCYQIRYQIFGVYVRKSNVKKRKKNKTKKIWFDWKESNFTLDDDKAIKYKYFFLNWTHTITPKHTTYIPLHTHIPYCVLYIPIYNKR